MTHYSFKFQSWIFITSVVDLFKAFQEVKQTMANTIPNTPLLPKKKVIVITFSTNVKTEVPNHCWDSRKS